MDLYHSRLTPDDLNDLIIKYKISRDLHPRLPSEEFVMSELPDDAIGIYHRMFDFSGVRIPFSSFLLSLIKHYRVHFSQLGPLGLNKGDWFSFTKRRAPSLVCIDDNRSCMKHWKSGFFLTDQRAILDSMVWRHPSATIDDSRPAAGSFSMADVRRLSAHVIKLRDMPEGVLVLYGLTMGIYDFLCLPEWTGAEVHDEPHLYVRLTLQRLPFYYTPPAVTNAVIPDPTPEDLAVGTPSFKILAKGEASQKRKASTSGATSSHVAKRIRYALAQSFGSTTRPSLFVDNSDDDACVEIPLVTPIRSAAVIPSSGNMGGSSAALAAKGPDSWGKGIMADDVVAPSVGVSQPRPSSGPAPSFRDVSINAIHADFFPFSASPYYATYPEGGIAGNCEFTRKEWDAPYRPTFGVLTKEVFKEPVVCKTVVDQFPTPGEMVQLLARYRGLNQSHHEYVLSADSRLKGYEEKVASLTGLELQVSTLKKQVFGLKDKLYSFDASFEKSKAKGKERKKKIKSLTKSLDNLHAEVARLSADLNRATVLEAEKDEEILRLKATPPEFSSFFRGQFQGLVQKFLASDEFSRVQGELFSLAASAGFECGLSMHRTKDEFVVVLKKMANFMPGAQDRLAKAFPLVAQTDYAFLNKISEHATETLSVILKLEPEKLACPANVPTLRDARVSPPIAMESTVTPAFGSLELSANVVLAPSGVASEQNEEWGTSHVLDDVAKVTVVGSERVSSGLTDVVVTYSVGEKGDGSLPSSVVDAEATTNPSGV
ncbi:hypothetical protein Tco_1159038 [Tanacetum coccineum]